MTALTEKSVASSGFLSVFDSTLWSVVPVELLGEPEPELVCSGEVVFDPDELESWLPDDDSIVWSAIFWWLAMICPEIASSPAAWKWV